MVPARLKDPFSTQKSRGIHFHVSGCLLYPGPEPRIRQVGHLTTAYDRLPCVVEAGGGRFLTLTLWDTAEDMHAAREAMGPVVERFLDPLMTAPTRLPWTGAVVLNDLVQPRDDAR